MNKNKRVFVSGCYDILHGGHVEFFLQAKSLGDHLTVCVANDDVLWNHKHRRSSIPLQHKVRLIESLSMVDKVVVGNCDIKGLDFKNAFEELKPDILATTEDDQYESLKRELCGKIGAEYVQLPKTLCFEKISTTDIVKMIRAPQEVPLRVDFGGGWLDVPKHSQNGAYIVNCTISPLVSLNDWKYNQGGGLGGSAAYAALTGLNAVQSELDLGVGWQDPAIIAETGLCVWNSGVKPNLYFKADPSILNGLLGLMWTGSPHFTPSKTSLPRNYDLIKLAGNIACRGVYDSDVTAIFMAVDTSYRAQLQEGMEPLTELEDTVSMKYCGGGWGGYALYCFNSREARDNAPVMKIEPYIRQPYA